MNLTNTLRCRDNYFPDFTVRKIEEDLARFIKLLRATPRFVNFKGINSLPRGMLL